MNEQFQMKVYSMASYHKIPIPKHSGEGFKTSSDLADTSK